jgi:intein/homing endonuclease
VNIENLLPIEIRSATSKKLREIFQVLKDLGVKPDELQISNLIEIVRDVIESNKCQTIKTIKLIGFAIYKQYYLTMVLFFLYAHNLTIRTYL